MKQYSVEHKTWKEDTTVFKEERMIPIRVATPAPIPRNEESRRFAANLEMVADMRFE